MRPTTKKILFGVILLCYCAFSVALSAQTVYYVSPKGKDSNKGTEKAPFKNIEKAQLEARKVTGNTVIYLRQGDYRLKNTLIFTSEDGNDTKQLVIEGYPGEKAVINGATLISPTWEGYRDGIMKAKLQIDFPVDMLTVNGEIRFMARFPNFDPNAVRFNGTSADATSKERVKTWKNPAGAFLHAMHASDWGDFHYRITGKDDEGNLRMEGGWQNNRQSPLSRSNRMVENVFEELDAPGEWFFNASEALLYYYPLPGENLENASFEVARLKHLVEFRGNEQNPVKNISIKNVELTQTARTFMEKYEPLLRSDWTIYRGAAVLFEGTENCSLENSYLHNLGGNALFFSNYNRYSTVSGSHLTRIGASAICFVGDTAAVRSPSFEYGQFVPLARMDRTIGPKTNNYPAYCTVSDNLIHSIGLFEKQISGVELSMCKSITVSHNSIYDVPRAGINISEGTWGGHIIEFNDVFNTVKETGDHGSFNSWGRDRFWHPNLGLMRDMVEKEPALILADASNTVVIRNNRFRCDRGWDIDLDDGSTNYRIYNNLCLNGGIKLREGFYRVVENNILINNTFHPHVWFNRSGDVFTRNVVMTEYKPINVSDWGATVDYNIFTSAEAMQASIKRNTDRNSIVYPIRFLDPEKGDFRIDPSCTPLFRIGFLNFAMDQFGVVSPKLKEIAQTPKFSMPIIEAGNETSNVIEWQGFRIKSLETLGERSATGMSSETGVYVISMVDTGSSLRDFLSANDVILKLGGKEVRNVKELKEILSQLNLAEIHELVLFRGQRENVIKLPANTLKRN